MSNVSSLFGGPTGLPEQNENCIAELERWIEMARSGEIRGVVLVGLCRDGLARYAIAGCVGGYSMLGAVEVAKSDLMEAVRA